MLFNGIFRGRIYRPFHKRNMNQWRNLDISDEGAQLNLLFGQKILKTVLEKKKLADSCGHPQTRQCQLHCTRSVSMGDTYTTDVFFVNCQQYKVDRSGNFFFTYFLFVKFALGNETFCGICN